MTLVLALGAGCSNDGGDDDDDGDSAAENGSGGPMSGASPEDDSEGPEDDSEGPEDDGESPDDESSGGGECFGDFLLGSVPFNGEGFLASCDDNPPTNCLGGSYIVFNDTGECLCIPDCSRAGLSAGDDCTTDGSVQCAQIENDSGNSSGLFCAPAEWNLC